MAMSRLQDILKYSAQARDLTLVALTCTYALGFLAWSGYAWRQGMGLLPIANTQYFIAGLPILFAMFVAYSLVRFRYWLQLWASADAPRRPRIVRRLTVAALVASALLEGFAPIPRTAWNLLAWEAYVIFKLLVFIMFFTLLVVNSTLDHGASRSGTSFWFWSQRLLIGPIALLLLWGSIQFVDQVLPTWPQEFGGFRPRRALLHVRGEDLSQSLRATLLPQSDAHAAGIRESREVLVLYADHERVIVKVPSDPQQRTAAEVQGAPAYELMTDVVVATTYLR